MLRMRSAKCQLPVTSALVTLIFVVFSFFFLFLPGDPLGTYGFLSPGCQEMGKRQGQSQGR